MCSKYFEMPMILNFTLLCATIRIKRNGILNIFFYVGDKCYKSVCFNPFKVSDSRLYNIFDAPAIY